MSGKKRLAACLVLEDGTEFSGWSFGEARSTAGEVVFSTGMTGYPQSLTDPSFHGQILVATYPLLGNYGVPVKRKTLTPYFDEYGIPVHFESGRIQAAGFVVSENCEEPSHFSCGASLSAWLEKEQIPAICGVDTRALTKRLREEGVMCGKIVVEGQGDVSFASGDISNPVADVSCGEVMVYTPRTPPAEGTDGGRRLRIALLDCGVKANILRCLLSRGAEVIRTPWDSELRDIDYDGIFLSNGPGDPKSCGRAIASLRRAFSVKKPIFGICLGSQLMALAAGGDTYKLPYGHRAQNQPCAVAGTNRCYITSQNHGYAVRGESLPLGWEPWFVNVNDGTIEGIRSADGLFSAVQFHPEGCPGPRDTEFLIDQFLDLTRRHAS
ncbi:MAG: glutamine-hydrolyzing carbamoyl-phosphate synthase small subunit [Spirochaetaceae bacterium]|jgi:carbamoyl-phosphate synthase small subunit|nr:glutamine-hydrolyzing carbamoyl-phosphate synthase small subunit [Spirochaetaceae bacterium]